MLKKWETAVARLMTAILLFSLCTFVSGADGSLASTDSAPDFSAYTAMGGVAYDPAVSLKEDGEAYHAFWDGNDYSFTVGQNIFSTFSAAYQAASRLGGTPRIFALSGELGNITISGPVELYGYYYRENPNQIVEGDTACPAANPKRVAELESVAGKITVTAGTTGEVAVRGLVMQGTFEDTARAISSVATGITLENIIVRQKSGVSTGTWVFNLANANSANTAESGAGNKDSFALKNCRLETLTSSRISSNSIPPVYSVDGLVTVAGTTTYFGFPQWRRYFQNASFTVKNCYFDQFLSTEGKGFFMTMEGLNKYNGACLIQFTNNIFSGDCADYVLSLFVKKGYQILVQGNTFLSSTLTASDPFYWNITYDKTYSDYLTAADVSNTNLSDRVTISQNRFVGFTKFQRQVNAVTTLNIRDNFFTDSLADYQSVLGKAPTMGTGYNAGFYWIDAACTISSATVPPLVLLASAVSKNAQSITVYTDQTTLNLADFGISAPIGTTLKVNGNSDLSAVPCVEGNNSMTLEVLSYDGKATAAYSLNVIVRSALGAAAAAIAEGNSRVASGCYTAASLSAYQTALDALKTAFQAGQDCSAAITQLSRLKSALAYTTTASAPLKDYALFSDLKRFQIADTADWKQLAAQVNAGVPFYGCTVALLADLDFNQETIAPIGGAFSGTDVPNLPAFYGTLEGNGHTIRHFVINEPTKVGVGLFGRTSCAVIRDLRIGTGSVTGLDKVGGIAGFGDGTLFERCSNQAAVSALDGSNGIGGIVSQARSAKSPYDSKTYYSRLVQCINYGAVTTVNSRACGIMAWGQSSAVLDRCVNLGALSGPASYPMGLYSGGTDLSGKIVNCFYTGDGTDPYATSFEKSAPFAAAWTCGFAVRNKQPVFPDCGETVFRAVLQSANPSGTYTCYGVSRMPVYFNQPGYIYTTVTVSGAEQLLDKLAFSQDLTLTGSAIAIQYSLSYVVNGGTFTAQPAETYTVADTVQLPGLHALKKDGQLFAGWYRKADFSAERVLSIPAGSRTDEVFYARFVPITYTITTASQLVALANMVNGGDRMTNKGVVLGADIDLTGVSFAPIGNAFSTPFEGIFDGAGYQIRNLSQSGLPVAGLVGVLGRSGSLTHLQVSGTVSGNVAGGIAGNNLGGLMEDCLFTGNVSSTATTVKIIGQNLRVNSSGDLHGVADRHIPVKNVLLAQDPDLIGFQEADATWKTYLPTDFSGYSYLWTWRGVGSDNTTKGFEATPIFYKTSKVNLLSNGVFWLSATPDTPSYCFNETMNRTVTWAKLQVKTTGEVFYYFNTHFPLDENSRIQSAALLQNRIAALCGDTTPFYITADYNMSPGSIPYNMIAGWSADLALQATVDATNNSNTINGFNVTPSARIDFCFGSKTLTTTSYYKVLLDTYTDSSGKVCPPSDHYGIYMETQLQSASGGIVGVNGGALEGCYAENGGSAALYGGALAGVNRGFLQGYYLSGKSSGLNAGQSQAGQGTSAAQAVYLLNQNISDAVFGLENGKAVLLPRGERVYQMIYLDEAGGLLYQDYLPASEGGSYSPDTASTVLDHWNKTENGDIWTYQALMRARTFTVRFFGDGQLLDTQTVAYGENAAAPVYAVPSGKVMTGWDTGFEAVTGDLNVNAVLYQEGLFTLTTATSGSGSITCNQASVENGAQQTAWCGTEFTLTADAGTFLYWKDETGTIVSEAPAYTFRLSKNTTLTGVFQTPGKATVTFLDQDHRILSARLLDLGQNAQSPLITTSNEKLLFAGWDHSLLNVQQDLLVRPCYTAGAPCQLTLLNGTADHAGPYAYGDAVVLTPDEAPEGTQFYGWSLDGETLLTTKAHYAVVMDQDLTLQALYQPAALQMIARTDGTVFQRRVEGDWTLLGAGVLASNQTQQQLLLEGADGTITVAFTDASLAKTARFSAPAGYRYYRGYLVLQNRRTGVYQTVYTALYAN